MISVLEFIAPAILSTERAFVGAVGDSDAVATVLSAIDWVLVGLGMLLAVAALFSLVRRGWHDPLAAAPIRINEFREDSVALSMLAYLLAALAFGALAQSIFGDEEGSMANLVAGSCAQLSGVVACLFIASSRYSGGLRRFLLGTAVPRIRPMAVLACGGFVLALAICPFVLAGSVIFARRVIPDFELPVHPTITALHGGASTFVSRLVLWTGAVAIAPLAEEVFFRGLLQTVVLNTARSRWKAITLVSVIFAAIHFSQPHAIPALFVLGVILGYAYERSGSLIPPIVIHALFNLKTLIWDSLGSSI